MLMIVNKRLKLIPNFTYLFLFKTGNLSTTASLNRSFIMLWLQKYKFVCKSFLVIIGFIRKVPPCIPLAPPIVKSGSLACAHVTRLSWHLSSRQQVIAPTRSSKRRQTNPLHPPACARVLLSAWRVIHSERSELGVNGNSHATF